MEVKVVSRDGKEVTAVMSRYGITLVGEKIDFYVQHDRNLGAVRADLFTGWGSWTDEPYLTAAALKQPLQLWVLWPR